ncbi:hypothetical protein JCM18694_16460 [Prolixibacter denitrificans]|uniref:Uncharacterized protein n=1 Tax=Prolixibacter denitrificans TaxID=1541063 RepID=A0ABQ0ZJ90_9BACT|nr:hypothetical protein JCM18694_16460 [Prolixibacter denitrificans]
MILLLNGLKNNGRYLAIMSPSIQAVSSIASLKLTDVGSYNEKVAKPKKKPRVVPSKPRFGVPFT